jgi:WhiB family redox-sensing transcriptional regulator
MTGFKLRQALDLDGDQDWRDHAACRKPANTTRAGWRLHDSIWYPAGDGGHYEQAQRICAICPVKAPCLEYALQFEAAKPGSRWGVFGGLTADQRRRLARKRGAA